jgi:hypothetical protein
LTTCRTLDAQFEYNGSAPPVAHTDVTLLDLYAADDDADMGACVTCREALRSPADLAGSTYVSLLFAAVINVNVAAAFALRASGRVMLHNCWLLSLGLAATYLLM